MGKAVFILFILLLLNKAQGFGMGERELKRSGADTISVDSLVYELVIIDPGFDTWLFGKPPIEFYSKNYYAYKNRFYVSEWNYRYTSWTNHSEYDSYIDYDPGIDYGLDLNYKLYYYFKYFEEKYRTKLNPAFR